MNTFSIATPRKRKRISLTPLIDVVFILLLFFMLTSSFQRWYAIDVPMNSLNSNEQINPTQPVFVLINASGLIKIWPGNKQWVSAHLLGEHLLGDHLVRDKDFSQGRQTTKVQSVLLIPEFHTPLQKIVSAMEHLESLKLSVTLTEPVESHD